MADPGDALEYFDLQGSTEMVTKTELMQYIRDCGEQISGRNVTYYSSVGLIPSAVRIGSRGGAYPKIVCELLRWIVRSRGHGLSIEAIKELVPLWQLLACGRRNGCIDLAEVEYIARERVTLPEANRAVPLLVTDMVNDLCGLCRQKTLWVLKDGNTVVSTDHDPLTLGFVLAELDPINGWGREVAWTQLRLPGIADLNADDPKTIILGIPNGVPLCPGSESGRPNPRSCAMAERTAAVCAG
jgi:DNA-binding transcriptional MerR regulator